MHGYVLLHLFFQINTISMICESTNHLGVSYVLKKNLFNSSLVEISDCFLIIYCDEKLHPSYEGLLYLNLPKILDI